MSIENYLDVWTGKYALSLDDEFFTDAVRVGRRYADERARG